MSGGVVDLAEREGLFEQWLDDTCERDPSVWELPAKLFNSWKRYAESANERTGTKNTFAERMTNAGFRAGNSRARKGPHWTGLRLKESPNDLSNDWPN